MNHRQTTQEISKRLPYLKRREVAAVLDVMAELWLDELAKPGGTVTVADLGKLTVEVQSVRQRLEQQHGAAAPQTLKRLYVRFRPTTKFRSAVAAYKEEGETA